MLVVGLRLLPAGVLDRATTVGLLKCLVAGLVMVAVVALARDLPLVVPILLGALTYGTVSLAIGAISISDFQLVRAYLLTRRQAASGAAA
jgi:hypothetical protein